MKLKPSCLLHYCIKRMPGTNYQFIRIRGGGWCTEIQKQKISLYKLLTLNYNFNQCLIMSYSEI